MQLVYLPKLRQATLEERKDFEQLLGLISADQDEQAQVQRQQLLAAMFHLLHAMEKQLLPYFSQLTPEEFNWVSWLVSPSLAETLVAERQPLPSRLTKDVSLLELESLPEAIGCAWALLNINQLALRLLPEEKSQSLGLNTELLQQLEDLAQIYCTSPADVQAAMAAAQQSLKLLYAKLHPWLLNRQPEVQSKASA